MSNFKVGEVCIGKNFTFWVHRNGAECVIIGGLKMRTGRCVMTGNIITSLKYFVEWSDGSKGQVAPYLLRRKQPPAGEQSILNMFKLLPPKRIKEHA